MKMYYRITSYSPLSNFEATTRSKPILPSSGLPFFAHNFYYFTGLLFGIQKCLSFIPSGYPLLFPIVKFFSEEPLSCYFNVPKYPRLLSTTKNVDTESKSKITPTADA